MKQPPPDDSAAGRIGASRQDGARRKTWGDIANLRTIIQASTENQSLARIDVNRVEKLVVIEIEKSCSHIIRITHWLHREPVQVIWMNCESLVLDRQFEKVTHVRIACR